MTAGSNSRLSEYTDEAHAIDMEIRKLREDKNEIIRSAKAAGYDAKSVRRVLSRMMKDRADVEADDAALRLLEEELGL